VIHSSSPIEVLFSEIFIFFSFALISNYLLKVQAMPYNTAAFEAAMDLPVINEGTPSDLFGDGSVVVYTRKCGYAGISYVAKNLDEKEALRFAISYL
jgi:hypothetical protein